MKHGGANVSGQWRLVIGQGNLGDRLGGGWRRVAPRVFGVEADLWEGGCPRHGAVPLSMRTGGGKHLPPLLNCYVHKSLTLTLAALPCLLARIQDISAGNLSLMHLTSRVSRRNVGWMACDFLPGRTPCPAPTAQPP